MLPKWRWSVRIMEIPRKWTPRIRLGRGAIQPKLVAGRKSVVADFVGRWCQGRKGARAQIYPAFSLSLSRSLLIRDWGQTFQGEEEEEKGCLFDDRVHSIRIPDIVAGALLPPAKGRNTKRNCINGWDVWDLLRDHRRLVVGLVVGLIVGWSRDLSLQVS